MPYVTDQKEYEPEEFARNRFGKLAMYAQWVEFEEGGEGFTIPGVTGFGGDERYFAGKRPVDEPGKNRAFHIVLALTQEDKNGTEYVASRDHLRSDKPYKNIVWPALKRVLKDVKMSGELYFVQVEETPTGRTWMNQDDEEVEETTFKVTASYSSEQAMKDARDAFFAELQEGAEADTAEGTDFPSGYTAEMWEKSVPDIKKSLADGKAPAEVAAEWGVEVGFVVALKE